MVPRSLRMPPPNQPPSRGSGFWEHPNSPSRWTSAHRARLDCRMTTHRALSSAIRCAVGVATILSPAKIVVVIGSCSLSMAEDVVETTTPTARYRSYLKLGTLAVDGMITSSSSPSSPATRWDLGFQTPKNRCRVVCPRFHTWLKVELSSRRPNPCEMVPRPAGSYFHRSDAIGRLFRTWRQAPSSASFPSPVPGVEFHSTQTQCPPSDGKAKADVLGSRPASQIAFFVVPPKRKSMTFLRRESESTLRETQLVVK